MGGWRLEIMRMSLYMVFPVGLFYYFNQPEYFEEWVINKRREIFPPENEDDRRMFEEAKRKIQERQEKRMIEAYEARKKQLAGSS